MSKLQPIIESAVNDQIRLKIYLTNENNYTEFL